jgi:putative tricarboxylic transport membrane protein
MNAAGLSGDRIAGALFLLVGIGAIWHAWSLDVPFAADPVGPKVFPMVVGAILAIAGAAILLRPDHVEWERGDYGRVILVAVASLVYPLVLDPLGFVPATTLLCFACAKAFRGPTLGSAIASVALAGSFLLLIDILLGLPLPRGPLGI